MSQFHLRHVTAGLLTLGLLAGTPERVRAAAPPCGPGPLTLRLVLVNAARVAPEILAEARREADAIWAAAGLQLVWLEPPAVIEPAAGRTVVVIVRPVLVRSRGPLAASRSARPALGWVPITPEGRPGNLVELSFEAIASTVRRASLVNRRVGDLPDWGQRPLLGRAMGRVMAHELGHWLGGREHAATGLMREALRAGDLVGAYAPALPRAWIAAGAHGLLARSSRCEAPLHASSK